MELHWYAVKSGYRSSIKQCGPLLDYIDTQVYLELHMSDKQLHVRMRYLWLVLVIIRLHEYALSYTVHYTVV